MHVILGILGSIVTILYLLDRLGVDLGGLNPWSWRRRRAWSRRYHGDPIHSVEDPMQIAAILVAGVAKLDGELDAEEKQAILDQFQSNFSLDARAASELLGSVTFLLGAPQVISAQLDGVMDRNKDRFTHEQADSLVRMAEAVTQTHGQASAGQIEYLAALREKVVPPAPQGDGSWAK